MGGLLLVMTPELALWLGFIMLRLSSLLILRFSHFMLDILHLHIALQLLSLAAGLVHIRKITWLTLMSLSLLAALLEFMLVRRLGLILLMLVHGLLVRRVLILR